MVAGIERWMMPKGKYKIVTCEGGFHGRTYGAITATAQPKYHEGLGPMLAGFSYVPFGDHCISPGVSWEQFKYYRERLNELIDNKGRV